MNDERAFERTLGGWLEAGPTQAPDRTVEAVLLTIANTSQERGRSVPWRKPAMTGLIRAVALASVAAAIISVPVIVSRSTQPAAVTPPPLPPTACPAGTDLKSGDIATVAGTGLQGYSGDGGAATSAAIQTWDNTGFYGGLIVGPEGDLYFTDPVGRAVRRVGSDGTIVTVAGPSTGAPFVLPGGMAFDPAGDLYIADPGASRIWKIDASGAITSVAGTGVSGSAGDGGSAATAQVNAGRVLIGPNGDLYLDDVYRVRRIDTRGVIHAFAGTGAAGSSGDGGQAAVATFGDSVSPAAAGADGTVYLSDPGNGRIRKVDPSGVVTTIVGPGTGSPLSGDGGLATDATLTESPFAIALSDDDHLYFTEWQRNSVRVVDPSGVIATVAGSDLGAVGSGGDCGPATSALLSGPQGLAYRDGALFLEDGLNNRIRMVVP